MEEPTNAALMVHLDYIRRAADETNSHLRTLNGRIGAAEQKIAVIESQASDAKASGKASGAKWGGMVGGAIAGASLVWQFFKGQP